MNFDKPFIELELNKKVQALFLFFSSREWTLSFAESCTGGLLSAAFAKQPGISKVFIGSVISYNKSIKQSVLGVESSSIAVHGEVSLPVALKMAQGVKALTKSHWAVSITGIAGPNGGSPEKPVGTVCFAVVGPGFECLQIKHFAPSPREKIQFNSVEFALSFLWDSVHQS